MKTPPPEVPFGSHAAAEPAAAAGPPGARKCRAATAAPSDAGTTAARRATGACSDRGAVRRRHHRRPARCRRAPRLSFRGLTGRGDALLRPAPSSRRQSTRPAAATSGVHGQHAPAPISAPVESAPHPRRMEPRHWPQGTPLPSNPSSGRHNIPQHLQRLGLPVIPKRRVKMVRGVTSRRARSPESG